MGRDPPRTLAPDLRCPFPFLLPLVRLPLRWFAAACAVLTLPACDESFSPIASSELQLSVFGYLDASVDTQWIRVMPMRASLPTGPGALGARVTVEHLGTGRVFELRDSVFRLQLNPEVGSEGVFLHNYWTTERIEPGASYRFTATPAGGVPSESEVTIPLPYRVEVWVSQRPGVPNAIRVEGLTHLAFATVTLYAYDGCGQLGERAVLEAGSAESGVHIIPIDWRVPPREGCGVTHVEWQELLVVGSGSEWPSGPEYATVALGVPTGPSNVTNAVGFLGGVLSRLVPYESCGLESPGGATDDYCRLRYEAGAATLTGTVTDAACTGDPVARASVRLRELDPVPPADRKVRSAPSRRTGEFEIGALEAGRYALSVTRPSTNPLEQYEEHTDTLVIAAGERATYDVPLRRARCA